MSPDHRGIIGAMASLDDYRRKRDPRTDAGAVRRRGRGGCAAASSSSATTPGGSTTTCGSSGTARSRAGRSRRGCRSSAGERHLAVHVEDHPLDYAVVRGRHPGRASTARARSRSGTSGTYELLEEKRDGGLTVRLHGERADGVWTLVPARLDGDERNWLLLRKDAARSGCAPELRPQLATRRRRPCRRGPGWLYEPKWDGYRAIVTVAGRRGDADEPQRQRPHRALPRDRTCRRPRRPHALGRDRRRGVRARRRRARPGSSRSSPARAASS